MSIKLLSDNDKIEIGSFPDTYKLENKDETMM